MMRSYLPLTVLFALGMISLTENVRASNDFDTNGTGDLADGVNWSDGVPPSAGSPGFIINSNDTQTFLSENLTTGTWNFLQPTGEFRIDLQGNKLTSDLLDFRPTPFSGFDPLTTTFAVRDGVVESNLELETGVFGNLQPQIINADVSSVDWAGEEWLLRGHAPPLHPEFEQTGTINVTINQGSNVTLDRLLSSGDTRIHVDGPAAELAFKQASISGGTPQQSVVTTNIFRQVAELRGENGATIRTRETNPPIVGRGATELTSFSSFSAFLRHLELDGAETRFLAPDANLALIELDISNNAVIETNRPLYILGEVEITNTTASHRLISVLDQGIVNVLTMGTGLEHKVSLNDATLNGDVDDFRFVELNDGILNGHVVNAQAIRGNGVINGDVRLRAIEFRGEEGFLPQGLIDVNGDVTDGIFMEVVLAGPPDINSPQVEVDTIDGLTTLEWTFISDENPFMINVDFEPLFNASIGDRFELVRSIGTILIVGVNSPGDIEGLQPLLRERVEEQLSGIQFTNKPAGYNFDIFIEPHAIGFTVVSVPELSSLALLTPPLLVVAMIQIRRRLLS